MYFTLAVSAVTPQLCAALTDRARIVDPAHMPIPGPARIAWRARDGRAAVLRWGEAAPGGAVPGGADGQQDTASRAGTIWIGTPTPGSGRAPVYGRTSITRVDPVYVAEVRGGVLIADRAMWAAWTADRLAAHDPLHICALLNPGFPLGSATPFSGVSALPPATTVHLLNGELTRVRDPAASGEMSRGAAIVPASPGLAGARAVAGALVAAVAPLRGAGRPVELSLTGGKDSRLIAAALVAGGVPVVARTHGFTDHPDVVVAAEIARRLGIEHVVRTPAAPGQEIDVLTRIRATVLVADGMLSAFENVGRPDPAVSAEITAGGHGGELLRGGYAETAAGSQGAGGPQGAGGSQGAGGEGGLRAALGPAKRAVRAAEMFRRLTTRHLGLIRRGPAAGYVASLAPWTPVLARTPLPALDDFYLVNRAGRWSAAARQAYLIRERLVQPLFDDRVVLAARDVPLEHRVSGALTAAVLAELRPALSDVPLAGKPPVAKGQPPKGAAIGAAHASFDWRRQYGVTIASLLRDYTLDLGAAGGLFDVVSRPAAEKLLTPPHTDPGSVWTLATLACLVSADYRHAREPSARLPVT